MEIDPRMHDGGFAGVIVESQRPQPKMRACQQRVAASRSTSLRAEYLCQGGEIAGLAL